MIIIIMKAAPFCFKSLGWVPSLPRPFCGEGATLVPCRCTLCTFGLKDLVLEGLCGAHVTEEYVYRRNKFPYSNLAQPILCMLWPPHHLSKFLTIVTLSHFLPPAATLLYIELHYPKRVLLIYSLNNATRPEFVFYLLIINYSTHPASTLLSVHVGHL